MTTKTADISITIRDAEGNPISNQNATGTTDDEGVTVTINLGYLADIQSVPPADIVFNLIPPPVPLAPSGVVSRTDDVENNTSTITFSF